MAVFVEHMSQKVRENPYCEKSSQFLIFLDKTEFFWETTSPGRLKFGIEVPRDVVHNSIVGIFEILISAIIMARQNFKFCQNQPFWQKSEL